MRGTAASDRLVGAPAESGFTGPLFIVGMPRSGTTLLRDLLRGHPLIRIPTAETNLLPRWTARWSRFGDLSERQRFAAFYRHALRAPYFDRMEKLTGRPIPEEVWYASCRSFGPADVFESLLRHDVGAPLGANLVWGDKSPDYTEHVALLAEIFPAARFIHVVRDVRDCCLSLRNVWHKNMIRGAQRWVDGVRKARREGELLPGRYLEVRYEDLLADREGQLRRCCDFLGLEFYPSMLGARRMVTDNVRKFERMLDPRTRRRIEAIAAPTLRAFGYDVEYEGPPRRPPRPLMAYYRVLDAVNYGLSAGRGPFGIVRVARSEVARRQPF